MHSMVLRRVRAIALTLALASATGFAMAQVPKAGEPAARPIKPMAPATLVFTIDVKWLGATSYRIERDVTAPIERAVKTLPGVKEVHSSSTGSRAQTLVIFDAKDDASAIATQLRNRLDQIKTRLPRGASQPLIGWRRDPTAP